MSIVIAESTARYLRPRAGRSDVTAVGTMPSIPPSSNSVDTMALRTFVDDCLTIGVGAQRALDRISTDATSLERLARWSMECEQRTQTGCLMVQALTLVRFWTMQTNQPITPNNEKIIVQWLREWYTKQSSTSNGADGSRMIQWRSLFALRLYAAMPSPHFPALLSSMLHVRISSLRLLQMRFWQDNDLPLFTSILQFVLQATISKHILAGVLQGWTRLDVPAGATVNSTINEFAKRIEAHMKTKHTQKCLRAAEAVMAPSELSALRQLQHVQVRATRTPPVVAAPVQYFLFQPIRATSSHASAAEVTLSMQMAPDFPPPVVVEQSPTHTTRRSAAARPSEESPTESKADTAMTDDHEDAAKRVLAASIASSHRAKRKPSSPRHSQRAKPKPSPLSSPKQKKRNSMEESAPSIDTSASEASEVERPAKKARPSRSSAEASSPVSTISSSTPSPPFDSHANAFSRAILPIAFAHPLNDALPFHPIVAAHLKEFGLAIVEPCFREHTAWLAELNAELLQHSSFQHAYRMTLGCFNDGSRRANGKPKPPPLQNGVYPSPPLSADEVFAFLEVQWSHMVQASSTPATDRAMELPQPPAVATDCLYLKDLSVEHQVRPRRAASTATSFFPKWDKKLSEEQERCDEVAAAASLCGTEVPPSASLTSDGDVEMKDVESESKHTFPALFMDAYSDHPASLLRLTNDRCEGVHNAYAYLKFGFQFFNLHIEQWLLPFVHHQLSGESTWILVPHTERHKLSAVVQQMARVRRMFLSGGESEVPAYSSLSPVLLYSKSLLPPLSLLDEHGIKYHRIQLRGGQVLVAHGGFAHFGFSTGAGETHAFACNIMSEEWLISGGPQFVVQFFEWMLDLSDLEANQVTNELIAYGMKHHQLADALNVCPPAYSCSLLRSLRDDLQRYVSIKEGATGSMPRGNYSLPLDQARTALSALDMAWNLLHHPHLRAFLRRVYVDANDSLSHLCECSDVVPTPRTDQLSESTVKGFYAAMERHHKLVVASGSSGSPLQARRRPPQVGETTTAATRDEETEAKQKELPISQTFGSVTSMPMSRLLDFLSSDARVPRSLRLSKSSHFLDIGSGIGQVVLHVQLRFALASSTGIEYVLDRFDAGETTLKCLRDAMATTMTNYPSPYDLTALRPALDDRVNRIQFIHGRIEKHLDLLTDATHVFMFDAAFSHSTHCAVIPLLCVGHSRIVVTCLSPARLLRAWPSKDEEGVPSNEEIRRMYRLLTQLSLTMAGSNSTRVVYVYATCS